MSADDRLSAALTEGLELLASWPTFAATYMQETAS